MAIIPVTLNSSDMGTGNTLSNSNFTVTNILANSAVRATHGKTFGKWYWEVKFNSGFFGSIIGVANKQFPLNASGDNANRRAYTGGNGYKLPENTSYGTAWAVGDIIGVALDLDNGKLEFYKNGVSMGVSHTNIKQLGEVYPIIGASADTSKTSTINFGATPFAYSIPSNFQPYNTEVSNKILLSSGDKFYSVSESTYSNSIPPMTSANSPSGNVISNGQASGMDAYKAFDGVLSTSNYWISNTANVGWIGYNFGKPIKLSKYTIGAISTLSNSSFQQMPKNFTFEGSNDGTSWITLDTRVNVVFSSTNAKQEFDIPDYNETYSQYRIRITAITLTGNNPLIPEIEMLVKDKSVVYNCSSGDEKSFINYGLSDKLAYNSQYSKITSIKSDSVALGSGKTFEHTINMSKRRVDKITLG